VTGDPAEYDCFTSVCESAVSPSTILRRADEGPTTTRLSARRRTMIGGTSASHRLVVGRPSAHPTKSRRPSYVGNVRRPNADAA